MWLAHLLPWALQALASVTMNLDTRTASYNSLTQTIIDRLRNPEVFHIVHRTIEDDAASTCHKRAYASLVQSCSSKQHNVNTDDRLDLVKTTFAARLAICDLAEVGMDTVPVMCTYFSDQSLQDWSYADPRLSMCLRGLHSDTQAWVSFSNAKQNAIAICHATRIHIEKDAIIEQYRTFAEVAKNVSDQSWQSTAELLRVQTDIIGAAQDLFTQLESTTLEQEERTAKLNDDMYRIALLGKQLEHMLAAYAREAELKTTALTSQQDLLAERQTSTLNNLQASQQVAIVVLDLVQQLQNDYIDMRTSITDAKTVSQDITRFMSQHMRKVQTASMAVVELHSKVQASGFQLETMINRVLKLVGIFKAALWLALAWTVLYALRCMFAVALQIGLCLRDVSGVTGEGGLRALV